MTRLSPPARALLAQVANADGPSLARRERVERELARALALNAATLLETGAAKASAVPAATATGAKLTTGALWWLLGGGALGALTLVPLTQLRAFAPAPHASMAIAPARASAQIAANPSRLAIPRDVAPVALHSAAPVAHRTAAPERPAKADPLPAPRAEEDQSVAAETALLANAQHALATHNAAGALALLNEHARRFPNGALSEERAGARVLALCALARGPEAQQAFAAFLRSSPRSPLIPRLQQSCAGSIAGGTP